MNKTFKPAAVIFGLVVFVSMACGCQQWNRKPLSLWSVNEGNHTEFVDADSPDESLNAHRSSSPRTMFGTSASADNTDGPTSALVVKPLSIQDYEHVNEESDSSSLVR